MKDEKTGEDLVSIGFVVDLEYADATTSAHDLLQTFKTHPLVQGILEGGERVAWGAKALPGGGYWSMPKLSMPGAVLVGDAGGMVDTVGAEGRAPLHQVGHARGRVDLRGAQARRARFESYEEAVEESSIGKELYEVRNTRQPFQKGFLLGGPLVGPVDRDQGQASPGRAGLAPQRRRADVRRQDQGPLSQARRQIHVRQALLGVHHRQRHPRRRAEPHPRAEHVPREIAETWRWMCPAGVYEIPEDAPETRRGRRDRQLHQLRAVRRDHRQGRAADDARGRRRAAVPGHLSRSPAPLAPARAQIGAQAELQP